MRLPKLLHQIVLGILLISILQFLCSCTEKPELGQLKHERPLLIGFAMDSLVVERWTRDRDSFLSRAKELGAEVLLQIANEDPEVQNRQIAWLINKKVDVLVVVPNDSDMVASAIKDARRMGIPVLNYDRLARNAGSDAFVSFDNEAIGRMIALALTQGLSRGSVVIINGSLRDNNAHLYNRGIHTVLDPLIARGEFVIRDEVWLQDWSNEEAESVVRGVLESLETPGDGLPDAILCANDFIAEAVSNVLAEKRLTGRVLLIGHDAELSACQRIVEGTQYATIYKPITQLGVLAAEVAVKLANKEAFNAPSSMNDGSYDVPSILLGVVTVTKLNMMETVILDGFHRYADVYRE